MCSIAGFCNLPDNWKNNIDRMNDTMLHRGPDAGGAWHNNDYSVVLGHRRLSIIDLSESGAQPMVSHNERYVLVFNGEIYNHAELREKLLSHDASVSFRGHSDTEVLLEYIATFGLKEALSSSKGMFAIALFDREDGKLFLSRDRIGEKPLYYGFIGGGFIFASELSAIRAHDSFSRSIDKQALSMYFRHGYIPAPMSIYNEVRKLMPGTIMEVSLPDLKTHEYKYWDIFSAAENACRNPFSGSETDATDELERLLKDSIRGQLEADVPVGAFLSGGIDSTAIVALATEVSSQPVRTFTIGFEEPDFDEASFARESASLLGTSHTEAYVSEKETMGVIPKLPAMFSEPFGDSSAIPTYLVSRLAAKHVTVSLSGDAGDELFCGYRTYTNLKSVWDKIKSIPAPIRSGIGGLLSFVSPRVGTAHNVFHYLQASSPSDLYIRVANGAYGTDSLVLGSSFPEYSYEKCQAIYGDDIMSGYMLSDLTLYHPDDILTKVDRSAMAVSLESRIPLLDRDVVEFALSLPLDYKFHDGVSKRVLKDVLYRYVPQEMMDRKKQGFSVPVGKWMRSGELRDWMESCLNRNRIIKEGLLDHTVIDWLKTEFIRSGRNAEKIWYLCMFEEWMEKSCYNHVVRR